MVDVNLKVPAIEKLLDYAASGIGAVAGPMLASWRARKEAEVRLIGARAEADSLTLIADARNEARRSLVEPDGAVSEMLEIGPEGGITQRIAFQERKRQANIAAVVRDAAAELGDKEVPDHEPDPDWTARFFDYVQDVSSEDMQKLWSQVLSGEIDCPGRTALRTLDILKNMTRQEAQLFQSACEYGIDDFILYPKEQQGYHPFLDVVHVMRLQDAGLLHASTSLAKIITFKESDAHIFCRNHVLKISSNYKQKEISISAIPLTRSGREFFQILCTNLSTNCLRLFSRILSDRNCALYIAGIVEELPDGIFKHSGFRPLEPAP